MEIPWEQLEEATLRALIEEYVSRDGTDYGEQEMNHETKVKQVYQLLKSRKLKLVFDSETQTCNFLEV